MRLLANENVPWDLVAALRKLGHDVMWIRVEAPGISDRKVLERAVEDRRILLTLDKDFGEVAYKFQMPAECGIILLKLPLSSPRVGTDIVLDAIKSRSDWAGHFSVIEPHRIRMRPLAVR